MGRIDQKRINASRRNTRTSGKTDSRDAAGTAAAEPYDFGSWFATQGGRLPKDFELEI
jgi:hypothetical protein